MIMIYTAVDTMIGTEVRKKEKIYSLYDRIISKLLQDRIGQDRIDLQIWQNVPYPLYYRKAAG